MIRNLLVLEDGTQIFSGGEGTALVSAEVTQCVNTGTALAPGAVCADMLQLTLLAADTALPKAGSKMTLYRVTQQGQRTRVGTFLAQKPVRNGALVSITGYDRLQLLDRDLTQWLRQCNGWPYSLQELARMVCQACALTLAEQEMPNAELSVAQFSGEGITGRQLLGWIAEAAGCFCRLDDREQVVLRWYEAAPVDIGPTEQSVSVELHTEAVVLTLPEGVGFSQGTLTLESPYLQATDRDGQVTLEVSEGPSRQYYYQGALALEDYRTAPIGQIQLRQSESDVGTVWPQQPQGRVLAITGNPLLAAQDAQSLLPAARVLLERLQGNSYTPCTVELPYTPGLAAGQAVHLWDAAGSCHNVYIMELTVSSRGMRICCTGIPQSSEALVTNSLTRTLQGKVLQLRADVDGLQAENSDNGGKLAALSLTVEGIRGQVTAQEGLQQRMTQLEQSAQQVQLTVQSLTEDGADKVRTGLGYTFDDRGLHIQGVGQTMENRLDSTGMYVTRNGQVLLQANHAGVQAVDVSVGNYLILGQHARLEDHGAGRTACFYIGG